MVELRKRKAPAEPAPEPASRKKSSNLVKKAVDTAKAAVTGGTANGTTPKPTVGETVTLEGFGGGIETQDGEKTTLKSLVDASKEGVAIFTYPKASTPGCTSQACMFRDAYEQLTSTGLSIYGLSTDSPKANTNFKTKQHLPYTLLCDPKATLIAAIGLKKSPSGTTRGVFVVDKLGKVLVAEAGGPQSTVDAVQKIIAAAPATVDKEEKKEEVAALEPPKVEEPQKVEEPPATEINYADDVAKANVAADVADSAATLDKTPNAGTPVAS